MTELPEWNEIRDDLRAGEPAEVRRAVVRVGKVKTNRLPRDIGAAVIGLFSHPDPEIRAEAIRAVGLHWRLESAVQPIVDLLEQDEDWHAQISAISALGALGLDHAHSRCAASKALARVVLDDRFAHNEQMIAYLELLRIQGKITSREYLVRDKQLLDNWPDLEVDLPWVEEVARRDCLEPTE